MTGVRRKCRERPVGITPHEISKQWQRLSKSNKKPYIQQLAAHGYTAQPGHGTLCKVIIKSAVLWRRQRLVILMIGYFHSVL